GNYLHEYLVKGPSSLAEIARDLGVSEKQLRELNKWTSNGKIPGDRTYSVAYIRKDIAPDRPLLVSNNPDFASTVHGKPNAQGFPVITGDRQLEHKPGAIKINGI